MVDREEKYHKLWARIAASKTLVTRADNKEAEVKLAKEEKYSRGVV
jgi:hypothetical protein